MTTLVKPNVLRVLVLSIAIVVSSTIAFGQNSQLLPVDGKPKGIKGVNLPWLDGAYGHDFGRSAREGWGSVYSKQKAEARFSDIGRMEANVMRVWVFQGFSGVTFDSDGYVSGIDPQFLANVKEAIAIADKHSVNCYLCLLNGLSEPRRLGKKDIVNDAKARSALINNLIVPFSTEMKGNSGVFAFDLANEPEGDIRGTTGNWTENGYTWDEVRTFLKQCVSAIHKVDGKRLVSVGSGWHRHENVLNGKYLDLGLDFFDFHEYRDDGHLIHSNEIRKNLAQLGASKRELSIPILIGECGQDKKNDDEIQRQAVAGFLSNAKAKGYAGALVWSYEWPGVKADKEWDRLLKGDGDSSWRPAAHEIKNFRWDDTKTAQQVSVSQVSIFIKENGEGKVIIDTRPDSQLEPLKALNPEKTVSLPFFGSADVAKFDEVRYHLRYDFSRFRSLSELKHSAMNEDGLKLWPTLKIDPVENALVFTPEPTLHQTRLLFPLRLQGNFALRANLLGVGNGRLSFGFFQGNAESEVILVTIHGAGSPEVIDNPGTPRSEPAGTVTVHQKQDEKALENKGKIQLAANDRQEINFQLSNGLTKKNSLIIFYGGVLPFGVRSMDIIAQFPSSFGIALDQKGNTILVNRLIKGGSGEAAGMKVGDELKAINGKKPTNLDDAMQLLGESDLQRGAKVEIARLGRTRTLQLHPVGVQRDAPSGLQFEGWEIYDMQSRGDYGRKNIKVNSNGELEFNAGMQEICILSKQSFGSGALKLEFQTDGNGGMIGVGATVKNRNGKDFFDRYPFCVETKLSGQIGLLVTPRADFQFEIAAEQNFDSKDRRKVLPLTKTQIDPGMWNSLECRFQGNDYLVSINGNIVNRLDAAEPTQGKIMIWPGTAKFKIRNSTFTSEDGQYKLDFNSLK